MGTKQESLLQLGAFFPRTRPRKADVISDYPGSYGVSADATADLASAVSIKWSSNMSVSSLRVETASTPVLPGPFQYSLAAEDSYDVTVYETEDNVPAYASCHFRLEIATTGGLSEYPIDASFYLTQYVNGLYLHNLVFTGNPASGDGDVIIAEGDISSSVEWEYGDWQEVDCTLHLDGGDDNYQTIPFKLILRLGKAEEIYQATNPDGTPGGAVYFGTKQLMDGFPSWPRIPGFPVPAQFSMYTTYASDYPSYLLSTVITTPASYSFTDPVLGRSYTVDSLRTATTISLPTDAVQGKEEFFEYINPTLAGIPLAIANVSWTSGATPPGNIGQPISSSYTATATIPFALSLTRSEVQVYDSVTLPSGATIRKALVSTNIDSKISGKWYYTAPGGVVAYAYPAIETDRPNVAQYSDPPSPYGQPLPAIYYPQTTLPGNQSQFHGLNPVVWMHVSIYENVTYEEIRKVSSGAGKIRIVTITPDITDLIAATLTPAQQEILNASVGSALASGNDQLAFDRFVEFLATPDGAALSASQVSMSADIPNYFSGLSGTPYSTSTGDGYDFKVTKNGVKQAIQVAGDIGTLYQTAQLLTAVGNFGLSNVVQANPVGFLIGTVVLGVKWYRMANREESAFESPYLLSNKDLDKFTATLPDDSSSPTPIP